MREEVVAEKFLWRDSEAEKGGSSTGRDTAL
jgi:hypothetical protein